MEETLRQSLFHLADAFTKATTVAGRPGMTRQTIGKRAINDNTFFVRIERGDGFTVKTYDKIVGWFSENWPGAVDWPAGIERPRVEERAA